MAFPVVRRLRFLIHRKQSHCCGRSDTVLGLALKLGYQFGADRRISAVDPDYNKGLPKKRKLRAIGYLGNVLDTEYVPINAAVEGCSLGLAKKLVFPFSVDGNNSRHELNFVRILNITE
ncbi:hypothetical protein [Devosia sp. 2618]|uniref:hypothetical protein n=1 Tax=Devosia sp. 2618 TaxID=3156454 RepID=UPI00339A4056